MQRLGNEVILAVGDDAARIEAASSGLRQAGYPVSTAPNGRGILDAAESLSPDLIVIDVSIPQQGVELCRLIRAGGSARATPIILATPPFGDGREGLQAGADEWLAAPYPIPLLVAKVARLIERKRLVSALRGGEHYYRALIANASSLISVLDAEGVMRYQSLALALALGYAPEELAGENVYDFIHPEDRPIVKRSFDESVAGDAPAKAEVRFRHKRGDWRHFVCDLINLLDDPAVGGVVVYAFDVTERVQAEESLRSREEMYFALLQRFPYGSVNILDRDFRFLLAEGRGLEQFGLSSERVVGKTLAELYPEEAVNYVTPYYRRAFEGEQVEFEISTAGQIFSLRAAPLPSRRGAIDSILVVADNITARKKDEEERALLAAVVESSDDAIISETPDGIITSWNKAAERLFGYTAAEVVGHPYSIVVPDEWTSEMARLREQIVLGERVPTYNAVRLAKGDRRIDISVTVSAIRDEVGRVSGIARVIRDIGELKRAEWKLRESEWQLVEAEKLAHLGSLSWDLQSDSVSRSEGIYRIFGLGPREFPPTLRGFLERVHPEDRREVQEVISSALADRRSYEISYRIIRPDGGVRIIQERGRIAPDEAGAPVKFVGALQDVTESWRTQEELRVGEERIRLLIEQVPAIIWSVDRELRVTFSQGSGLERLGIKQNELVGKSLHEFLRTRDPESQSIQAHLKALQGESSGYETEFEGRVYSTSIKPLRGLDGEVAGVIALSLDITEFKNVEEGLKQSRESLRALAARLLAVREEESLRIARELHDELGGSMTGLRWDLQSVAEGLAGVEMGRDLRGRLAEKVGSMNRLIDSTIQTVRRISSELRPSILDDLGLVSAVEWQAQQFQARTGITCVSHTTIEAAKLSRDCAVTVYRILQEALTNVLRHAQATRVDLSMSKTEKEFLLEIRDDGKGISEQESAGGGSLGLLGMRERAHLVGGELRISGSPGEGTTVMLRVPL